MWTGIFFSSRLQEISRGSGLLDHLNKVLTGLVINLSIVFALWFAFQPQDYPRNLLFITYLVFTLTILLWRSVWHYSIRYYRAKGFNYRNVLIIGNDDLSESLAEYINDNLFLGYRLNGVTSYQSRKELGREVKARRIDVIFCCLTNMKADQIREIINYAEENLIKINLFSQFSKLVSYNLSFRRLGSIPIIEINKIPLDSRINKFIKRAFDIIFSLIIFIMILTWLMPLIALIIRIESKGPILFKQKRHGCNNELFEIYKFRSMYIHEERGFEQATKNDSRVTKIGSILRKTSIDELPQFINVLKGEMSVVGPRPHAMEHNTEYQPKIDRFWQRHVVKPGITGLAQIKGLRGETTKLSDMSGRVKLDRFYIKKWSLLLDIKIILLTVISLIKGDQNAY